MTRTLHRHSSAVPRHSRAVPRHSRGGGNPLRLAFIFAVISLAASPASAQVTTGLPPFGSFSGGPDIVNNANLNVHLSIPVENKAGRGIPFSYNLTYDSSIWYPVTVSGATTWQPLTNWGWPGVTTVTSGYFTFSTSQANCFYPPGANGQVYWYTVWSSWAYHDAAGGTHWPYLPGGGSVSNISSVTPCTSTGPPSQATGSANDGSGWSATVYAGGQGTAYYRNGDIMNAPLPSSAGPIGDTNGNEITNSVQGTTTTFTDTLGTGALTVSRPTPSPTNPTTFTYLGASGNPATVTMNYAPYTVQTNFGCSGTTEYGATAQNLVSSIVLPDGTSYNFTYEVTPNDTHNPPYVTGRLAKVTLPAGGYIKYSYSGGSYGITCTDGSTATLTREVNDNNGNDSTWSYAHTENGTAWTTTITDPQSNQTVMNFQTIYETERQLASLETIYTCYNGTAFPCNTASVTPGFTQRTVTTSIGGLESQVNTNYNSNGLPTEVDEYGYGSGAVGSLVRKTTIAYNTSLTNNIYDHPATVSVYNGSGTLLRQASYSYDGSSFTSTPGTPQHYNPSGSRGNLTSLALSGYAFNNLSASLTYYDTGGAQVVTDFNGAQTTYNSGTGACGNSFPTTISLPMSLSESLAWNCNGAVKTSVTDPNSNATSFSYDNMNRLVGISYPDSGISHIQYTSATVHDFCTLISGSVTGFCTPASGSLARQDETVFDGLGRTVHQDLVSDPAGESYVDTTYDSLGRPYTLSNPYRSTSDPSYGNDTYSYDALSRVTKIAHTDSSSRQFSYVSATQSCSGSTYGYGYPALYTDEAGNKRRIFAEALGRVIEVDEPDPNNGNTLTLNTCYAYDAQGNLSGVAQGSQTRSYSYDGLSRLTQATTPEAGTTHYYYTTSGGALCANSQQLVCRKTDARSITTTYVYDALNRLTSKTYSDSTPPANFYYDQSSVTIGSWSSGTLGNPKGRMTEATTTSSGSVQTAVVYSYDKMGRTQDLWQCTPYNCGSSGIWEAQYTYDLAGDITSWVHPRPITFTNTVNSAQQITAIQSSWVDSNHPQYVAQSMSYTPWGALSTLVDGCAGSGCTNVQETYTYNNRLQPWMIELGTSGGNTAADYCLVYNYFSSWTAPSSCPSPSAVPTSGPANNGNVMGYWYQDNVNSSLSHTATYTYDSVNRITNAVATGNATYNLTSGYDRYGNMTCVTNGQTNGPCPNWTFNSSTNQLNTSQGFVYDAAGDLSTDVSDPSGPYTRNYAWDAEGRVTQVTDNGGNTSRSYVYNALGQRVEIKTSGGQLEQVFDPQGERIAYYSVASGNNQWLYAYVPWRGRGLARYGLTTEFDFFHANALASATMATNPTTGAVIEDILFYPWGEEFNAPTLYDAHFAGLPASTLPSFADLSIRETPYRFYAPNPGRWQSPDPLGGDITNPQSLNRYAYVLNNPTSLIDPAGLDPCNENNSSYEGSGNPPWTQCAGQSDPSEPPGGVNTDPTDPSAYGYYASSQQPPGLLPSGNPMYPSLGGGGGIGIGGGGSGLGSGPLSGDFGPLGYPSAGGWGPPCDFGSCGSGMPGGNGFAGVDDVIALDVVFHVTGWGSILSAGLTGGILLAGAAALPYDIYKGYQLAQAYGYFLPKPVPVSNTQTKATTGSSHMDCIQQLIADLKACADKYPPGPERQGCMQNARIKFRYCKGKSSGGVQ